MSKSNADFSRLVSSKKYILTPADDGHTKSNRNTQKNDRSESEISDSKRAEKKRKRAERKKKYFDRKKAAKEKERAQKEEEEFNATLHAKLSKTENKRFEDLPEEYRKLIGGDFEHTHMVKGLDYGLLRQTKANIAKQQTEDIEIAYHDTKTTHNEPYNADNDGDISMIMNIESLWAHNIHKAVMKHYHKDTTRAQKQINPKFCNGMSYKFDLDSDTSVPTEIMRSQTGCIYGLVLDDFNEFEEDNIDKKVCTGYTPIDTIKAITQSLNTPKDVDAIDTKPKKITPKKRKFSEIKEDAKVVNDDFDIFEDAGRDYVCDPKQEPKRRRVSFTTPTMEKMKKKLSYFEGQNININRSEESNVKQAAASILKSSLDKVKSKKKKTNIIPKKVDSLRGKLLSSGFSAYDDDDDDDRSEDHRSNANKKNAASAKAELEWKQMQDTFGKTGKNTSESMKERLNNPQKTPSLKKFFC